MIIKIDPETDRRLIHAMRDQLIINRKAGKWNGDRATAIRILLGAGYRAAEILAAADKAVALAGADQVQRSAPGSKEET